jgi:hypothetical protein
VAFGAQRPTIGFDLNKGKLNAYVRGHDPSGEVSEAQFEAATQLEFTSQPAALTDADVIIVVVPTPIDHAKRPDLAPGVGGAHRRRAPAPGSDRRVRVHGLPRLHRGGLRADPRGGVGPALGRPPGACGRRQGLLRGLLAGAHQSG